MSVEVSAPATDLEHPEVRAPLAPRIVERLYREQAAKLRRFFLRRPAGRTDCDDLVHDAFVRLGKAPAPTGPEAYLGRIAVNLVRDRARSAAYRLTDGEAVVDQEIPALHDPHRHLEARDMLRRLEHAMLRLKPKTREIFMAHRLDGLSYAEIAERTGLSIKGVEKQMSLAIATLDRLLDRR